MKKEEKKDRGLALKARESDSSDFDEEGMSMTARKFKNSSKRPKANTRMAIPARRRTVTEISSQDALSVEGKIML